MKNRKTIVAILIAMTAMQVNAQNVGQKTKTSNATTVKTTDKSVAEKKSETVDATSAQPMALRDSVPAHHPFLFQPEGENASLFTNLKYEEVITLMNEKMTKLKRKRQSTTEAQAEKDNANHCLTFLKGTDQVTIIDSLVVDKKRLLDYYNMNPELGKFYHPTGKEETVCYKTERGNKVYTAIPDSNGIMRLTVFNNDEDGLSSPTLLTGMETDGDQNYPFMMPDGLTLYLAARSTDGLGNYDLYVTRLDDGNHFFKAENLGFPYNSYANDYMMVIDEVHNIGMFASDRYQPTNKVCLYFFVPNKSRMPFDYENDDHEKIRRAASLRSISATQGNTAALKAGQNRLAQMRQSAQQALVRPDFEFVVNDNKVFYHLDDFTNANVRKQAEQWIQMKKNLESLEAQLEELRMNYHNGGTQIRDVLKDKIKGLEKRIPELAKELKDKEKAIRKMLN